MFFFLLFEAMTAFSLSLSLFQAVFFFAVAKRRKKAFLSLSLLIPGPPLRKRGKKAQFFDPPPFLPSLREA